MGFFKLHIPLTSHLKLACQFHINFRHENLQSPIIILDKPKPQSEQFMKTIPAKTKV